MVVDARLSLGEAGYRRGTTESRATDRGTCSLRIYLLGGFRVERTGGAVPTMAWLRRIAARSLVKILAVQPGHRLHRDQLLEMLWPDVDLESALNRFAKALHAARRALEPELAVGAASLYLRLTDGILILDADDAWIDADHFESVAARALASGDLMLLEEAVSVYDGALLPEDLYEDWASIRRDALAHLYVQVLMKLNQALEQRGMIERATEPLRAILEQDPTMEEAHRGLMRLYALVGSRHQALRQYQACKDLLRSELDAAPDQETEALHQAILRGTLLQRAPTAVAEEVAPAPSPLPVAIQRVPTDRLIGRDRVLKVLLDDLQVAMESSGRMVLVTGEAGIGKTRLSAELAREAWSRGVLVLWGAGYDQESLMPYGAFVEALDEHLTTRSESERACIVSRYPELARLVPSLSLPDHVDHGATSPEGERGLLFAAISRFLADLAANRPVLLVLDDLHAIDGTSLQYVQHLLRSAVHHRWLIIGTYREEGIATGSELSRLVTMALREGLARRVSLRKLAHEDCVQMIEDLLGRGRVDISLSHRLHRLSLGNPLFLQELVQSMHDAGEIDLVNDTWQAASVSVTSVPQRIRDLVDERVKSLDLDTRRVLDIASAFGTESSFNVLQPASGMEEAATLDALDLALDSGMLEERGDGYTFPHPLFRQALYEQLSAQRRRYIHLKVAEVMERLDPNNVEALAYHHARAHLDKKTLFYLQKAGDRARVRNAYDAAEGYYMSLIERCKSVDSPVALATAQQKLGAILIVQGRYEEAEGMVQNALGGYRLSGDGEGLARALTQIGRLHLSRGTFAKGISALESCLGELQTRVSHHRMAELHLSLGRLLYAARRYQESSCIVERVVTLAQEAGGLRIVAMAEAFQGILLQHMGRWDDGLSLQEEAVRLAHSAEDLDSLRWALLHAGLGAVLRNDMDRAGPHLTRLVGLAVQTGDPLWLGVAHTLLGRFLLLLGNRTEARSQLQTAVDSTRSTGASWFAAYPLLGLSELANSEDKVDEAATYLDDALTVTKEEQRERVAELASAIRNGRPMVGVQAGAGDMKIA